MLGAALPFPNAACGDEADAFIMSQQHRVTAPGEPPAETIAGGFTCSNVASGSGSTSGGSRAEDFWVIERIDVSGAHVEVGSFDQVLVTRHYDRGFIAARAVEQLSVTTQNGVGYAFVYWGGTSCERCPPEPFTPRPGDISGCGSDAGSGLGATP